MPIAINVHYFNVYRSGTPTSKADIFSLTLSQIEHLGTVSSILVDSGGCTLTISHSAPILGDCHIGDSIAVNGACLTVTEFDEERLGGWFKVWLANETLERTDLGGFGFLYVFHVGTGIEGGFNDVDFR